MTGVLFLCSFIFANDLKTDFQEMKTFHLLQCEYSRGLNENDISKINLKTAVKLIIWADYCRIFLQPFEQDLYFIQSLPIILMYIFKA